MSFCSTKTPRGHEKHLIIPSSSSVWSLGTPCLGNMFGAPSVQGRQTETVVYSKFSVVLTMSSPSRPSGQRGLGSTLSGLGLWPPDPPAKSKLVCQRILGSNLTKSDLSGLALPPDRSNQASTLGKCPGPSQTTNPRPYDPPPSGEQQFRASLGCFSLRSSGRVAPFRTMGPLASARAWQLSDKGHKDGQ